MKDCPSQHGLHFDDDRVKFCWKCGGELRDYTSTVCDCGRAFLKSDFYCAYCGKQRPN